MRDKAAVCRGNKSLPIDEEKKMNEMNVNNQIQVDREIGECMVHLTFSDRNNPVIGDEPLRDFGLIEYR